jgi:hypothetical protein
MALRKLAGPFVYHVVEGLYTPLAVDFWCDELDGILAYGQWPKYPGDYVSVFGRGVLQLDGTFTPRRSLPYATEPDLGYDLATRTLSRLISSYSEQTQTTSYWVERGADWNLLQYPYTPQLIPVNIDPDGVHAYFTHFRMFLPDRMIFIGYKIEGQFYTGPFETKIFGVSYDGVTPPQVEHTIQTSLVPGSGVLETWKPLGPTSVRFMQSATPNRTVYIARQDSSGSSKVVEYDYIAKQTVGWVRRLGAQPDLDAAAGVPGAQPPHIIGYSTKHKVWLVQDNIVGNDGWSLEKRLSIFADGAVPATLSNPVALSPTRAGEAVRYRVLLSGASHEPCIGHRVNWGCSALGTVITPQTITDQNGYAEALIAFPPRQDGPLEGTNITAEVTY